VAKLIFLELNELNIEHVRIYAAHGELPVLARLIEENGLSETTSESDYDELEPWIQWVTAHTGLSLIDHGVFRLGDIRNHDHPQIWEVLEAQGLKVGAVSPMNAKNRCKNAAFFIPDPWTPTQPTASPLLRQLYEAVAQAVNDNAQSRISPQSALWLLTGAARYARAENYSTYVRLVTRARQEPWSKSMFLDLLLADVFIKEVRRANPDFASLFLNAGAHIQHHYMFNSSAYSGPLRNPEWYAAPDADPVLDIYRLYDRIVGQVQEAIPQARLMIATGLHQDPHPEVTFYWRLKHHASFLSRIKAPFESVEPRMSRDFLVTCRNADDAMRAARLLEAAKAEDGTALFEVDNRGSDLFVMLTYPHDIASDFIYTIDNKSYEGLKDDVAFVAVKNGRHNGIGYFIDGGARPGEVPARFALRDIPVRICEAMGVEWDPSIRAAAEMPPHPGGAAARAAPAIPCTISSSPDTSRARVGASRSGDPR
jgi:hypothetical protein